MRERPVAVAFIVATSSCVFASGVFIIGLRGTALMSGFLSPKGLVLGCWRMCYVNRVAVSRISRVLEF